MICFQIYYVMIENIYNPVFLNKRSKQRKRGIFPLIFNSENF